MIREVCVVVVGLVIHSEYKCSILMMSLETNKTLALKCGTKRGQDEQP